MSFKIRWYEKFFLLFKKGFVIREENRFFTFKKLGNKIFLIKESV